MWIFTGGNPDTDEIASFISAVQHPKYDELLVVRARDRESLDGLLQTSSFTIVDSGGADLPEEAAALISEDVVENAGTDYPFRIVIARQALQDYLTEQVEGLGYGNFKSQAVRSRPGRVWHDALMDVWSAMLKVEPARAFRW